MSERAKRSSKTPGKVDSRSKSVNRPGAATENDNDEQDGGIASYFTPMDKTADSIVLREMREFRRESKDFRKEVLQRFDDIDEKLLDTNARLAEAEDRIGKTEERLQANEEATSEMLTLLTQMDANLADQQARSMRDNVRIFGISEDLTTNVIMNDFVEQLLREGLGLTDQPLQIQRSHRSLGPKPPTGAQPRSIVAKFLSYKTKEMVLSEAWKRKSFMWRNQRVTLDNDLPPSILRKRREYKDTRKALQEKGIGFKTLYPARLKVKYSEGEKIYDTATEATRDLVKRGFQVQIVRSPETLLEKIRQLTWQRKERRGRGRERERRPPTQRRDHADDEGTRQRSRRADPLSPVGPPDRGPLGGDEDDGERGGAVEEEKDESGDE